MSGYFTQELMRWNKGCNKRTMPWKGIHDPYKIWLSEVILQQTRVEQGWNYYEAFLKHYPRIQDLAEAKDAEVFKLWEGLGYYNRCKNLLFTARYITRQLNGKFPTSYNNILALKGIGPYTAAAISSFAYNLPYAVVDGNVFRVLSRYFGLDIPIDSQAGKTRFAELAAGVLDKKHSGLYNQAIMDFGATVCTPSAPDCTNCPLSVQCAAYTTGKVNLLPIKEKVLTKKTRYFTWFILQVKDTVYLHQRTGKDIWQNLFEFYLVETENKPHWNLLSVQQWTEKQFGLQPLRITISENRQQLTHQLIKASFLLVELPQKPKILASHLWVKKAALEKYAFPKMPKEYISDRLQPQG